MKISAIVCIDFDLGWLSEALTSIARQTRPPEEIILVKSARTPASVEEIEARFLIKKSVTQEMPGLAEARNLGLQLADHELVAFLDGDDIWSENKLEIQSELLLSGGFDAMVGLLERFKEGEGSNGLYSSGHFTENVPALTPGGVLIQKKVFENTGLFDNRYRISCDHEWFMRLMDSGAKIGKHADLVLRKRIHCNNLSNNAEAYRKEIFEMLKNRVRS